MPDLSQIKVGNQQEEVLKALYFGESKTPEFGIGKHELMNILESCVNDCEIDVRSTLRQSLVLAGGNTLLPNFDKLLDQSLHGTQYGVKERKGDRQLSSCYGSAILAKLDFENGSYNDCNVSRSAYEEFGIENLL